MVVEKKIYGQECHTSFYRFLRQGKSHSHRLYSKLTFTTISLFIEVSQSTGVVVGETMKTIPIGSIQTCCIFSQAAHGVESALTDP